MKLKSSSHYARMLTAQKLLKARDEAELAALKHDLNVLAEENHLLALMLARGSYADFVDPQLIAQRIERNHRAGSRLTDKIETQIANWLQSSRRADRMTEKKAQARAHEARNQLSKSLDDIITQSLYNPFKA